MISKSLSILLLATAGSLAGPVPLIDYDDGIPGNGIHETSLNNGGFEDGDANATLADTPAWKSYFAEGSATPAILDTAPHTGTKHAIASGFSAAGNRVHPGQAFSESTWTIRAGDVFKIHFWGKSFTNFDAGADAVQVIIHVINSSGAAVADSAHGENGTDRLMTRDFPIPQAGVWTECSATSNPVAEGSPWIGKRIQIRILNTGDRNELATIDDVTLTADHNPVVEPPVAAAPIDIDPVDPTAKAGIIAKPNIVFIYADDLGFGDISCQGATAVRTPRIDSLATNGLRFTDAHAAAPTCTPSRFSVLTGSYPWRTAGTGIAAGNAALLIRPGSVTLPGILRQAGYNTGAVGKWHLGLGTGTTDFTKPIKPGPLEIGFDYFFGLPATADRVPCVYLENHDIYRLRQNVPNVSPLLVSYGGKIGNEPTLEEIPAADRNSSPLLRPLAPYVVPGYTTYQSDAGHAKTIINGISRIGYMTGAEDARWKDEDMAGQLVDKAGAFIQQQAPAAKPFFLYFATNDIHVPRVPNSRFVGTSSHGIRGDAIHQLDWQVGQILDRLDDPNLDGDKSDSVAGNTLVIFTSDNGPVLNDGYFDGAGANPGNHDINGPYKGGKYSSSEGGHRLPFIVRWPGVVTANTTSSALVSQTDLMASFAKLVGQPLPVDAGQDSQNILPALLGKSPVGRSVLVNQENSPTAIRWDNFKYFFNGSLYQLANDPGETTDLRGANQTTIARMNAAFTDLSSAPKISPFAAWWPLDEGSGSAARDLSGLNHRGELTGNPGWGFEAGKPFLRFNGIDQSITAANLPSLESDLTLTLWARSSSPSWNATTALISRHSQFSLSTVAATKQIIFTVTAAGGSDESVSFDLATSTDLSLTDWHHFAATFDASNGVAALYVDGIKRASKILNARALATSSEPLRLASNGTTFFSGDLSDVRLYTTHLNAQRVANAASGRLIDEDHDGILDDWEYLHSLDPFNPLDATQDADSDTVTNLDEFRQNTNPLIAGSNVAPTLIAHLKLDESSGSLAADSSGFHHDGSHNGSPLPASTPGRRFLSFDGGDDFVEIPNLPDLASGVTVAAWAKSDTATWNIAGSLVSRRSQWVLHPWKNTTRISFLVVPSDTGAEVLADFDLSSIPGFSITDWHHYAGSYDAATGQVRIYVDGLLRQTTTLAPVRLKSETGSALIGKDGIQSRFFAGDLDEIRIYNGAINAADVAALAAGFDDDQDGLPDELERLIINADANDSLRNLADVLPADDFDHDGFTNLEESLAGTNPADSADCLKILSSGLVTEATPNGFKVTIQGRAGRVYSLEHSVDLNPPWTEVDRKGPFAADRLIEFFHPSSPAAKAFYRVRLSSSED